MEKGYLQAQPNDSKLWRLKYRYLEKGKKLATPICVALFLPPMLIVLLSQQAIAVLQEPRPFAGTVDSASERGNPKKEKLRFITG